MNAMVKCTQNDENVLLVNHQTSSMKRHLTETHEHNFEYGIILTKYLFNLEEKEAEMHELGRFCECMGVWEGGGGVKRAKLPVALFAAHQKVVCLGLTSRDSTRSI